MKYTNFIKKHKQGLRHVGLLLSTNSKKIAKLSYQKSESEDSFDVILWYDEETDKYYQAFYYTTAEWVEIDEGDGYSDSDLVYNYSSMPITQEVDKDEWFEWAYAEAEVRAKLDRAYTEAYDRYVKGEIGYSGIPRGAGYSIDLIDYTKEGY